MEKAEITIKSYGREYSIKGLDNDMEGEEWLDTFKRLLVATGFGAGILNNEDGAYVWQPYDK